MTPEGRILAGIGCRRDCPAEDIVALVAQAEQATGRAPTALAAPVGKSGEPGLRAAAERLALPVILVEPDALAAAQPRCVTRSAAAERALGVASVAEGCALAAAGSGARLVLPRIAGPRATCALAEGIA